MLIINITCAHIYVLVLTTYKPKRPVNVVHICYKSDIRASVDR